MRVLVQTLEGSAAPARNVNVRIYGDKAKVGKTSVDVELPLDMPTEQIAAHCAEKLGFAAYDAVVLHNQNSIITDMCYEIPPLAFTVTPHKQSYYDTPPAGLRVYEDEKLINGLNRGFKKEMKCSIKSDNGHNYLSFDDDLRIMFQRTIRVPDDGKEHRLPPSLGTFPILNIADYEQRLPADMREKGGVFIPMYQREAMWMSFHSRREFAIKIYLGGVNGISGEPMIPTNPKPAKEAARKQDYLVVPTQPWIDGVVVSPGLVKQFVAMPFGSGYSVEKQVTGEENVGGIQFEVIPVYDENVYFIARYQFFVEMVKEMSLAAMATAKSLELQPGEMIYCKKIKETAMRVRTVKDLLSDAGALLELDLCEMINGQLRVQIFGTQSSYSIHGNSTEPFESIGIEMEKRTGLPRAGRCFCIGGKRIETWKDMYCLSPASSEGVGAPRSDIMLDWARELTLEIKLYYTPLKFKMKVVEAETVRSLLERVDKMAEIPTDEDLGTAGWVIFKEEYLQDEQTLGESGVADGDTITVKHVGILHCKIMRSYAGSANISQMGIAAGGTVKQDIYPDEYDPESWNTENIKLVNVQVVNSVAFEEITGMAAPETPIGPETYASLGLPFFDLYSEERPSTVSGDFSGVKTVSEMDATLQAREDAEYNPAAPEICIVCKTRIRDCLIRPCNHCICKQCAEQILSISDPSSRQCPQCERAITRIVGIAAPMNAPGHEGRGEPFNVVTLNITDVRERFTSIRQ